MNSVKTFVGGIVAMALCVSISAQTKLPPGWQSSHVKVTPEGELAYYPDKQGNTIPDFSRVGYHHGDKSIPYCPVTKVVYPVENGDSRQRIQDAIDEVARMKPDKDGHRGTVLLKRGVYHVHGTIRINTSGVVLTGEGDNVNETRLLAIGKQRFSLIQVSGEGRIEEVPGTRVKITDMFVPVGTHSFQVSSSANFKVGDRIIVYRPGTDNWIHDIKMDQIIERKGTRQWTAQEYNLSFEREIVKIEGNRIFIDNPVVMQMEDKYGGGEVFKYTFAGRISEVGVTNMCLESEFEHYEDNQHGWIGVQFDKVENCWARNLTCRYFGYSAVSCERNAKM